MKKLPLFLLLFSIQATAVVTDTPPQFPVQVQNVAGTYINPSTSEKQDTGNASAASIDSKLNTLGQKTSANSVPVVISSDQSTLIAQAPLDVLSATTNITTQDIATATTIGYASQPATIGNPTAGSFATLTVSSVQTVMVVITGIWTGTLQTEVSSDNGTIYVPRSIHVVGSPIYSSAITANVTGSLNASAKTQVRVRATSAITGTAVVRFLTSDNPSNIYVANAIKVVDGSSTLSTNPLTIKSPSTAAVAADAAVVVAINPATAINLPTGASTSALQTTGNTTLSTISTAQTSGTQKSQTVDGSGNIQPSGDVNTRAIFVKQTDGTNNATVKAASTAAVASDTALVVAISPNNTISSSVTVPLTASSPTVASVGVASASAVAANATRRGLILQNNSINTIYLGIGATAVIGSGVTLYPGGSYQMDVSSLSTAVVNAIATGAASSMAIQEFTP